MKRRITIGILLLLFLASFFTPWFSVYAHMALPQEIASAFPGDVSGITLLSKGVNIFPIDLMPSLRYIPFRIGLLGIALCLVALGALLVLIPNAWANRLAVVIGGCGTLALLLFSFYFQALEQSVLFSVLFTTKWYIWVPFILSFALSVMEVFNIRHIAPLRSNDRAWRSISAVLCGVALIMLVLPFAGSYSQLGTFSSFEADSLASRQENGIQWLLNSEAPLKELGSGGETFSGIINGGALQKLVTLSDSGSTVKNLFLVPTQNGSLRVMAIAAVLLLLIGLMLQLIRKVDRWIPACLLSLSSILLLSEVVGTLQVDSNYQFNGAISQMMYLGLGGYTLVPFLMCFATVGSAISAALGIYRADEPYFVNPIPQRKRILTISLSFSIAAAVLLLTPVVQVNLYTPGKINQSNPTVSANLSGVQMLLFQQPDALMNPTNVRGKVLYAEETVKNGLTLSGLQALVSGILHKISLLLIVTLLVTLAIIVLLLSRKRNKRLIVTLLLLAALLQAVTVLAATLLMPKDVGFIAGLAPLYCAIGFSIFAAFYAGFLDYEELPKKFKLFLMMLPFLVAVFLFSYLPLSGWRYAFYNYKLGLSMDQQEYVGFQWFTTLWSNVAQQSETVRVLRNTFAMSGISLMTSWLPMAFAIFLTEIRTGWFKKFVQVFTTLPNFISWVLVFSFALTMFSLDTGIVNKAFMALGIIQEPIAYLNSGEHIWIKMWVWYTWKTLGWSAIMYLAAIAGIDQELYEAAKVDGAGRWRQIMHITIPGILPTFFVLLLLQISNVVNNGMEQYLVFQNAMNKSTIEVLDLYVYNISLGTRSSNTISMATAIGILKSLVSIVLLFLANSFSKAVRGESIV